MRKMIWLALGAAIAASPSLASQGEGKSAPTLVVRELDGKTFDLAAYKGRPVIVDVWATWCIPCRKELPALDAFYRRHRKDGVEVLALSADRARDRKDVAEIAKQFSFPAAIAADAKKDGLGPHTVVPVTYLIDTQGVVRARLTPDVVELTEPELEARMEMLMAARR